MPRMTSTQKAAWRRRHEAELEAKRIERAATKAIAKDPLNDPFTIEIAGRLGMTPAAFLELQEQRRAEMRASRETPGAVIRGSIVDLTEVNRARTEAELEEQLRREIAERDAADDALVAKELRRVH